MRSLIGPIVIAGLAGIALDLHLYGPCLYAVLCFFWVIRSEK